MELVGVIGILLGVIASIYLILRKAPFLLFVAIFMVGIMLTKWLDSPTFFLGVSACLVVAILDLLLGGQIHKYIESRISSSDEK